VINRRFSSTVVTGPALQEIFPGKASLAGNCKINAFTASTLQTGQMLWSPVEQLANSLSGVAVVITHSGLQSPEVQKPTDAAAVAVLFRESSKWG
jgi:hypothetical protein